MAALVSQKRMDGLCLYQSTGVHMKTLKTLFRHKNAIAAIVCASALGSSLNQHTFKDDTFIFSVLTILNMLFHLNEFRVAMRYWFLFMIHVVLIGGTSLCGQLALLNDNMFMYCIMLVCCFIIGREIAINTLEWEDTCNW